MCRKPCRICASTDLTEFFNLGDLPLANGLLNSPDDPEERFPLNVLSCNQCGLVQLGHVVPAEKLYRPDYPFQTSSSARMVEHFAALFEEHAVEGGHVVEIGGNDSSGYDSFWRRRAPYLPPIHYLNIDPAGAGAMDQKVLFTEQVGAGLARNGWKADLIVAANVLGHVDDLHDFMRGVTAMLKPGGKFVFEVPHAGRTFEGAQYDQFYHEHLSYFTLGPLLYLLAQHDLGAAKVEHFPVHGGSVRVIATRGVKEEGEINSLDARQTFAARAQSSRAALWARLCELRRNRKRVIAYGASAKGAIVLNYCGIGTDLVDEVMDCTAAKVGKFMPGTHQRIVKDYNQLVGGILDPDAVLLLAWNHAAEIKAKHPEFSGEWLLPHGEA